MNKTHTPNSDLVVERVQYPDGDTLFGYLAHPKDMEPRPAIVVIQEWWGLNEHIEDVTRRFARAGFVALAPDLYHGAKATEPDEARKMAMELKISDAVHEIRRAIDYLLALENVAGPKVGIVGFCMGGHLVLETTRAEPNVGSAVVFYGRPLAPDHASEIKAPLLGIYGEEDHGISPDQVQAMAQAMETASTPHEMHIYPGAGHAFFNDTRHSYNPQAAADAWERAIAWFLKYL